MRKPTSTKPTPVSSRADRVAAAAAPWQADYDSLRSAAWRSRELRSIIRIDRRRAAWLRSCPEVRDMANSSNIRIATRSAASAEEWFWQAIRTRDADYDGLFYYGVRATGGYLRPSCAPPPPRRAKHLLLSPAAT